jgi:hypothetical protein
LSFIRLEKSTSEINKLSKGLHPNQGIELINLSILKENTSTKKIDSSKSKVLALDLCNKLMELASTKAIHKANFI